MKKNEFEMTGSVEYSNVTMKDDHLKERLDLLPLGCLLEVSRVMMHGAAKYGEQNWRGGIAWSRWYSACLRHLIAWHDGEDDDPESGFSHLAHAICCLLFLMEAKHKGFGCDDRVSSKEDGVK